MRPASIATLLLAPLLLAGACTEPTVDDPWYVGISLPASYEADAVALRVGVVRGESPPIHHVTRVPTITIYGDGRVVTARSADPYPVMPAVIVRTISQEAVRSLAQRALRAGVGKREFYDEPYAADYDTTRFTVLTADGELHTDVYALELDDAGMTAAERRARQQLARLREELLDLPTTLGAGQVGPEQPYEPVVVAAVNELPYNPDEPAVERAWSGPALPGADLGVDALSCVEVSGPALAEVRAQAATADEETYWVWEGQRYLVRLRPLLPDEPSCAELVSVRWLLE